MTSAGAEAAATPPDRPDGAWHEAVGFSSPTDLAERIAPRVARSTAVGDPVLAVLAPDTRSALEAELRDDAAGVRFLDPLRVHALPAFTVAVRWARTNRRISMPQGRALVVGQRLEHLPGCGPDYWARLDIALDVATARLPVTVLCPFPTEDPQELVRATHPHVGTAEGFGAGTGYRAPQDAVLDFPEPPPPDLGRPSAHRPFDLATLVELRSTVTAVGDAAGLDLARVADLVMAVNELASNSIEHGAGAGTLQMWPDADGVTAEIFDGGRMDLSFPGMTQPPAESERGRGLWLACELCDVLQIWSSDRGTTVRVRLGDDGQTAGEDHGGM